MRDFKDCIEEARARLKDDPTEANAIELLYHIMELTAISMKEIAVEVCEIGERMDELERKVRQ